MMPGSFYLPRDAVVFTHEIFAAFYLVSFGEEAEIAARRGPSSTAVKSDVVRILNTARSMD